MKRLLIIEDDEILAAGLVRSLSRRNYSCLMASTGQSALDLAEKNQPGFILMDLMLGQESTQDLIIPLKQKVPRAKLVVLTGNGTIPSAVQAVKDGAASYLTKPATPDAIDRALSEPDLKTSSDPELWTLENDHIAKILEECGGNISQAAKKLGLHRRTLQRRLKKI